MTFSAQDHDRLTEAANLIKDVADRHPSGDLRVISFLCSALQDMRMAELVDAAGPEPSTQNSVTGSVTGAVVQGQTFGPIDMRS